MPLRANIADSDSFNMTPMIDVVFNLLIFFLLSATYANEERELELSVPTVKSAAPAAPSPRAIEVVVHSDGRVELQGESVTAPVLESRLVQAKRNYPDQSVAIRGDRGARYQWVADVLSICRRAGIRKVDVIVRQQD